MKDGGYSEKVGSGCGLDSSREVSGVHRVCGMNVDRDDINVWEVSVKV